METFKVPALVRKRDAYKQNAASTEDNYLSRRVLVRPLPRLGLEQVLRWLLVVAGTLRLAPLKILFDQGAKGGTGSIDRVVRISIDKVHKVVLCEEVDRQLCSLLPGVSRRAVD